MNKYKLFLVILFFTIGSLKAIGQSNDKIKTLWSKEHKTDRRTTIENVLKVSNNFTVIHKTSKDDSREIYSKVHLLEKYNKNLDLIKSLNVSKLLHKNKKDIEQIFNAGKQIYVLSSDKKALNNSKNLYLHQLDFDNFEIEYDVEAIVNISYKNYNEEMQIFVEISEDSSKFLIAFDHPNRPKAKEKIGLITFNNNAEILVNEIINFEYEDRKLEVVEFAISNDGKIVIATEYFENTLTKILRKDKPNYKTLLFVFDKNDLKELKIEQKEKLLSDLQIKFDNNNKIVLVGFYADEHLYELNGTFLQRIKMDDFDVELNTFNQFEINTITKNTTAKETKRLIKKFNRNGKVPLYNYEIKDVKVKQNNELIIVAEEFYRAESTFSDTKTNLSNFPNVEVTYVFNNVLILNYSENGELNWSAKINKNQILREADLDYASFSHGFYNDKIYLVYNDNSKNLNLDFTEKRPIPFSVHNKMNTVIYTINDKGKVFRKKLFNGKECKVLVKPKFAKPFGNNKFLIFGDKNNYQRLGKIIIN